MVILGSTRHTEARIRWRLAQCPGVGFSEKAGSYSPLCPIFKIAVWVMLDLIWISNAIAGSIIIPMAAFVGLRPYSTTTRLRVLNQSFRATLVQIAPYSIDRSLLATRLWDQLVIFLNLYLPFGVNRPCRNRVVYRMGRY